VPVVRQKFHLPHRPKLWSHLSWIGKILLAAKILVRMYEFKSDEYVLRSFAARQIGDRRNWYHLFINHLREPLRVKDAEPPNVYVVTFNYDLSLEHTLAESLEETFLHKNGLSGLQRPKILHVNGGPESVPTRITDAVKFVCDCAKEIHLVGDAANARLEDARQTARSAIANSGTVYVLGFQFDDANVSTIGLRERPDKSRVFCHNFNGHAGVTQSFLKLGVGKNQLMAGTVQNPIFIDEAIGNGFFQQ
jgi:hypothetical protein